MDIDHKVKLI